MRTLIVHADDFNLTPGVCDGIAQAFEHGVVRSTSVMANLPGLDQAAARLRTLAGLDVGIHFNLTLGHPVSPAVEVATLVDESGRFHKRQQLQAAELSVEDLRRELLAQIGAVEAHGVKVSHVDTHHHIHESVRIAGVIEDVVAERGLAMRSYGADMCGTLQKRGIHTPQTLITKFYGEADVTLSMLLDIIRDLPAGVSELCCHPARIDEDLRSISSYVDPRARELELLCSTDVRDALTRANVHLASYGNAF